MISADIGMNTLSCLSFFWFFLSCSLSYVLFSLFSPPSLVDMDSAEGAKFLSRYNDQRGKNSEGSCEGPELARYSGMASTINRFR